MTCIIGAIDDLYKKSSRFSKLKLLCFSIRSIRLSTVLEQGEHCFTLLKKSPHRIVVVDVGVRGRGEAMLELVGVVRVDPLALVGEQKGEGGGR